MLTPIPKHPDYLHFRSKHNLYKFTMEDIESLKNEINDLLGKYKKYDGIDFCDVGAHGVQMRVFHKEIFGYCLFSETLMYDFSNREDLVKKVVKIWENTNPEDINKYNEFLKDGEKYGWD